MKLNKEVYEENVSIGTFKEIKSSIRSQDLGIAFDMVSKNLYSNPIGSFVREIVSNGVDANKDNEVSKLVSVNVFKEDDAWWFTVTDLGKGMSPEHIEGVYMNWFNSDKRDSDDDIGGWGLGSKSPLAYAQSYELITVSEGIEYHYIIARASLVPTATLLSTKPTNNPSGTTVKIEIKEQDMYTLGEELNNQLAYFNNVIVKNDAHWYDNTFQIIDTDLYKVRNRGYPFGNQMHIVLGQVAYPINWELLNIERISCPVAIKFEIKELPVTLSREEINYNEGSTKEFIISRINAVTAQLKEIYDKDLITDNIFEFIKLWNDSRTSIKIGDFDTPYLSTRGHKPKFSFQGQLYNIKKDSLSELFKAFYYRSLDNTKMSDITLQVDIKTFGYYSVYYRKNEVNHWSNLYRNEGKIISKRKITNNMLKRYGLLLGTAHGEGIAFGRIKTVYKEGGLLTAYKFIQYLEKAIIEKVIGNYDYIPDTFIEETKRQQELLKEERKGNITHYNLTGNQTTEPLTMLLVKYDNIFYIDKDTTTKELVAYTALFRTLPNYFTKKNKLLILSTSSIKKHKRLKEFKKASDVFRYTKLSNFFGRFKQLSEANSKDIVFDNLTALSSVSIYYDSLYSKLYNYKKDITLYDTFEAKNKDDDRRKTINVPVNVANYFNKELSKYGKENVRLTMYIEELSKVITPLKRLVKLYQSYDTEKAIEYSKEIIRVNKLTKLNTKYYEKH